MTHFLLTYDRHRGELDLKEFSDAKRARAEFSELERVHFGDDRIEVVLLGARSKDELLVTHGRYFRELEIPSI